MLVAVLMSTLLIGALADNPKEDVQLMNLNVKSVKGGYGYRGGENLNRFFNNTSHGYVQANQDHEVGVCYIEVPTSSLARDPKHITAGNGSRSDLSRIRTCCHGYIRNIHNFHICDPVCSTECVNSLCTAPETCTCFPDHVKNAAGFCVATCPIGCQNGHCNGGQCLCKEGFKLDNGGKFCVPHCRDNCGGIGNCTAPNTCQCKPGYSSTPDGSCRGLEVAPYPGSVFPGGSYQRGDTPAPGSQCGPCINGQCVGSECRCRQGYLQYRGECKALCNPNCGPNTECVAPNVCAPKAPGVNTTQPNNSGTYTNSQHYPYPSQHTSYQNPSHGNGLGPGVSQGQYPYPTDSDSQNNINQQNPNSPRPANPGYQPNPTYAPYPGQQNQYPDQQNQWSQTNHGQPNGTNYPNQYPGQYPPPSQHLYPNLPSNNYPYPQTNQRNPNGTGPVSQGPDGQVYYQNRPYNPLADVTFNLQQGGTEKTIVPGQNGTQGQYAGGQYSQGQFGHEQNSQGQYSHGQSSQGQYGQGQYSQGKYGQGQYSQGQIGQGQYSQDQYNQGQHSQGQYGQGQYGQGQYGQGQYGQGQYGQGRNNQGQYGQGQYGQGQYGQGQNNQGQYGQGQYNLGQGQYPYGQNLTEGGQVSNTGFGSCEQPCLNGNCIGHNNCECFPGYNLDPSDSTRTRCIPYCHGGCLNGHCASPNNCVCDEGYHKDFTVKGRSSCVKRLRRSAEEEPSKIADLLVFEIPDYE